MDSTQIILLVLVVILFVLPLGIGFLLLGAYLLTKNGAAQPPGAQESNIPTVGTKSAKAVTGLLKSYGWVITILVLLFLFVPWPWSCEKEESSPPLSPPASSVVIPPTVDHPSTEAEKGEKKEVVINVSPDTIMQWMLERMATPEYGWTLMERTSTQAVNRQGYLPLPVGPLLPGAKIELELEGARFLLRTPSWKVLNQNGDHVMWLPEKQGEITTEAVALFLEVHEDSLGSRSPLFGEVVKPPGLKCTATVTSSNPAALWIGLYGRFPLLSLQYPGMIPMRIGGEDVTWTMRLTFIPFTPVASGAQELKETASPPGFYDTQQPKIWLLPNGSVIDPKKAREELDSKSIFGKILKPRFLDRDSPARDSFEVTSAEVRRVMKKEGKEAEAALVYLQPVMDSLVYWEIFFPVSTETD